MLEAVGATVVFWSRMGFCDNEVKKEIANGQASHGESFQGCKFDATRCIRYVKRICEMILDFKA
jgi:hypothetical protein